MDIQLTEEQELLRSSLQRFLRDQYDFDMRRKIVATDEGWSRKRWKASPSLASAQPHSRKALVVSAGDRRRR